MRINEDVCEDTFGSQKAADKQGYFVMGHNMANLKKEKKCDMLTSYLHAT